jgi:hypothetical protein
LTDEKKCPYPDDLKARFEGSGEAMGYACYTCADRECIHNKGGC